MIIFHEGLPRSGKSYECLVHRIIPALKQGRAVDAYVEGLDHDKIAGAAGIEPDACRELLHVVSAEDVPNIWQVSRDNALVVIDEVQDFFGVRAKVSPEMTKFITQHGHRGIDVVLMGQDFRDANALFRRRIEIKQHFFKLSGVGAENSYRVTTQRHKGHDDYEDVSTEVHKYDKRYFGTYASHVAATIQTGNYKDNRANLLRGKFFTIVLPGALLLGGAGVWYAVKFFKGETMVKSPAAAASSASSGLPPPVRYVMGKPVPPGAAPAVASVVERKVPPVEARLAALSKDGDIRFAGQLGAGARVDGVVEWIEKGGRTLQRLSLADLRELGVSMTVGKSYLLLKLGEWEAVAMMWPIEPMLGKVSEDRNYQASGKAGRVSLSGGTGPGGVTGLGTYRDESGAVVKPLQALPVGVAVPSPSVPLSRS